MNSVQRHVNATYGDGAYQTLRETAFELPACWVEPPADPDCRCAADPTTWSGHMRVNGKVRLCGACERGQWRARGMRLTPYGA
jgi:hypothetical protein